MVYVFSLILFWLTHELGLHNLNSRLQHHKCIESVSLIFSMDHQSNLIDQIWILRYNDKEGVKCKIKIESTYPILMVNGCLFFQWFSAVYSTRSRGK